MAAFALASMLALSSCRVASKKIAGSLQGPRTYVAHDGRWSVEMPREVALDDPGWTVVESEDGSDVYLEVVDAFGSRLESVRVVRAPGRARPERIDPAEEARLFDGMLAEAAARTRGEIQLVHRDTIDLDGVAAVYRYYVEPIPAQNLGPIALFQSTPPGRHASLYLLVDRGEAVACFALDVVSTERVGATDTEELLVLEPHWERFVAFARSFRMHPAGFSGAAGSTAK
jgi:hypothetical protein